MNYSSLSIAGKFVIAIFLVLATIPFVYLGFGWSLSQTINFVSLMFPTDPRAGVLLGLAIQFSPNVFFLLASRAEAGNEKLIWRVLALLFTFIDAGTNIGERIQKTSIYDFVFIMGLILDIGITMAEELIASFVAVLFDVIADIIDGLGGSAPGWFRMAGNISYSAATSRNRKRRSRNRRRKKQSNSRSSDGGGASEYPTQNYNNNDDYFNPPNF